MAPDEYAKALEKSLTDLEDRIQRRDLVNAEIAGLRETVRVLSNRTALNKEGQERVAKLLAMVDYATPSLTDSIRALLSRNFPNLMTATEIRNTLEDSGFDFDDFSNSLSACHAALKRLLKEGEVEPGTAKDGKATFRGVLKLGPIPTRMGGILSDMALQSIARGVRAEGREGVPTEPPRQPPPHVFVRRDKK
jgi:hypothetical protein